MSNEHALFRLGSPLAAETEATLRQALAVMNGVVDIMVDAPGGSIAIEYDSDRIQSALLREVLEDSGCKPK